MPDKKKGQKRKLTLKTFGVLLILCLAVIMSAAAIYAEGGTPIRNLQNGGFEAGPTWTGSPDYKQLNQSEVPYWNTTAKEGKIELFKENSGTYIKDGENNVKLKPTEGSYAAELNADEESTLYQIVNTTPSSVYQWGLDHGARNGVDTMALVIGPNQDINPSKPDKNGRDQFMQMVDWLIEKGETSVKTTGGLAEQLTVYSKKFDANGTFKNNADGSPFSMTPSTIYTEEWHIWIMSSKKEPVGLVNNWNSYGANSEGSGGSSGGSGGTGLDLSKYYYYTVPEGQSKTLFGFVSVGYVDSPAEPNKEKTYGNFLDNVNFELYHPLSGSTTAHGSAVVVGSDGSSGGSGSSGGNEITVDNDLVTYVTDGESLKIEGIVKKADADEGCEFIGVYYTYLDSYGNTKTDFIGLSENVTDDNSSWTDEYRMSIGKWIKSTNADGDIIYTYYLKNITTPAGLHFVFIKNPTISYDPNGGKPYVVEREYNITEAQNVYSYKPHKFDSGGKTDYIFISPYVSHAAEGQNDGWKFMGWLLTGDTVTSSDSIVKINSDKLGSLILPGVHTVACDYLIGGVSTEAQYFKIYDRNVALTGVKIIDGENVKGVNWNDSGEEKVYANVHKGLTMVAQWRWRQAFIPQLRSGDTYINSNDGGSVEITSVSDPSDTNYDASYNSKGGKAYFAETAEIVTARAAAKEGFTFDGWYDKNGNLITREAVYSYTEIKGSVNTFYARFSGKVTQTYIRQIRSGSSWADTDDDNIGTLSLYSYTDAPGKPVISIATPGAGYRFVGWYDSDGKDVSDSMLINSGAGISYTTTGDAKYYARFAAGTTGTVTIKYVPVTPEGGSVSLGTETVNVSGGTVTGSTAAANEGYYFAGWYDNEACTGTPVCIDKTYVPKKIDATYYAKFEKQKMLEITVIGNSDSKVYNGSEQSVSGYTVKYTVNGAEVSCPEGITLALNSGSSDNATAKGTDVSDTGYFMALSEADFTVTDTSDEYKYTLTVIPGKLIITPKSGGGSKPSLNMENHVAYIIGYPDGTVQPGNNITRAEVATIFFRLLTDESRAEFWSQINSYSDVKDTDWYNNAVSTLGNAGIIAGYPDGTFRPDGYITRAEFAVIAARFSEEVYNSGSSFSDVSDNHWAAGFISLAEHLGYINGYPDGTFRPDQTITRAEAMTLINRVLERTVDEEHMASDMVKWVDNLSGAWYYEAVQEATNSHEYVRLSEQVPEHGFCYENWKKILDVPDWAALEKTWSTANSK